MERQDNKYLIIIDTQGNVNEVSLGRIGKDRIYIGRTAGRNDIVIPAPGVSGTHGKFKLEGGQLYYADLGSTNGTILDADGFRKLIRGNSRYIELKPGNMLRIQPEETRADQSVLIMYAERIGSGSWQRFPLMAAVSTIGRDVTNDIVINHMSVSRFHARIVRKDNRDGGPQYVLEDAGSYNGLFVNAQKVYKQTILQEKDIIRIAGHTLIYSNGMIFYKTELQGINIAIENVSKIVGGNKKILNEVCTNIESNEFVAIVGGSGAGKTTLMTAISGFDPAFTGTVTFNGIDVKAHFRELKDLIGFVPQEDIIYENLTLRRMLLYTAKLKLPKDTSKEEMDRRIDQVLGMVELTAHQDTFIRKLSGGQKKRASIAVELLADPSVFFLDEPTSGLDPGTEQKLMITLNKLSKSQGKTIVMVTHTTQSLQLCDRVIFMGRGGNLCFSGTPEQAKMFFDTDNLVDVYNMTNEEPLVWAEQFRSVSEADRTMSTTGGREGLGPRKKGIAWRQFPILMCRYLELIKNDLQRLLMLFLQPVAIALLLSVVANEKAFFVYDDTKSILFSLSCAGIWIGLFNSIQEICKERAILRREYMGNLRLGLYTASKFFVQTLVGAIQALIMTVIFYFLVGHPQQGILFKSSLPETMLTLWVTIEAAMAIGFVISSMVKNTDRAMTLAPFVLIVQLLFSGILFELSGAGNYISYVTVSKWSVEALGSSAVLNDLPSGIQRAMPTAVRDAEKLFLSTSGHLWATWGIMLGMTLICALLCVILLRSVAKDGR